jgi:sensor histidine kinase YesM
MSWADSLRFEITYAWLWAVCTPLITGVAGRLRYERGRWLPNISIHLALMTFVVAATRVTFDFITNPPQSMFHGFSLEKAFRSIESTFDTGALMYAVPVLIEHALLFQRRYREGQARAAALQTRLVEARLQALKMQLHPHFLFNALHTIAALVHEDPDLAERTIARLGELLRLFLATTAIHEVPLGEELRVLDLYLEIERARFEKRLQVRYDVADSLRRAMVPNLVLQPLVENAIRHGVGRMAEPGWIVVAAERRSDSLLLRVTDNGAGLGDSEKEDSIKSGRRGTGLAITRGRLATLYGPKQSLVLRNLAEGGVEASITLPFGTEARTNIENDHVELHSLDC